jgi:hypothetical protein
MPSLSAVTLCFCFIFLDTSSFFGCVFFVLLASASSFLLSLFPFLAHTRVGKRKRRPHEGLGVVFREPLLPCGASSGK